MLGSQLYNQKTKTSTFNYHNRMHSLVADKKYISLAEIILFHEEKGIPIKWAK